MKACRVSGWGVGGISALPISPGCTQTEVLACDEFTHNLIPTRSQREQVTWMDKYHQCWVDWGRAQS